jgi:hypothetical protein
MPVHSFQVGTFTCKVTQEGGRIGDVEMLKKTFSTVPPDRIEVAYHALSPEQAEFI